MELLEKGERATLSFSSRRVVLEESIMQRDFPATAGSKILANFIAPLNAAVVDRLNLAGLEVAGRAKMVEFGIGRISSDEPDTLSGAVEMVVQGVAEAALCNDFSGKIRRQAPEKGLCYIHPTYGTVSRYGLIPSISSMDQIGVLCGNIRDGFDILSAISGNDPRDGAMFPEKSFSYCRKTDRIKIGVPANVMAVTDPKTRRSAETFAARFESESFELPFFNVYSQVMYILGCAEISNNINRYDGVKFGYRAENYRGLNDLYIRTRTEALGPQTKLAAIMGSMVLSKEAYTPYYEKAMKIRRLIKESTAFDRYDAVVIPSLQEADPYVQNAVYALATLAGLPAVSFPWRGSSIHLVANVKDENTLLTAWEAANEI